MRVGPAIVAGLAAAAGLAGCSAFDPYPTFPQPAATGAKEPGGRVAICYEPVVSSGIEVQKAAQDECAAQTLATRVDTDWKLDYCPLFLPARATFVCEPKNAPKK
jgi:hypothetical protein